MTQHAAIDVAKYFLSQCDPEADEGISHLKLQKLLYYAQGFHLAIENKPLFRERIEAWLHGPVVSELYQEYKGYGNKALPVPSDFDPATVFTPRELEILDEVYEVYGQFAAWKLRDMTHEEPPWKDANAAGRSEITHEALRDYFRTCLAE